RHARPRAAPQARPGGHHHAARRRLPPGVMRRRLMLAIAGVAAATVIGFALPLALVLRHSYRDEPLLRLQRDTIAATRAVDLGAPGRDPVELPASHDQLTVYDVTGRRVAGQGPGTADPPTRAALSSGRPADGFEDGPL